MFRKVADAAAAMFILSTLAVTAFGGSVAIINGSSSTTEPGTTSLITSNLIALQTAAGNTSTVFDTTPASLAGFSSVWDLRWSNSTALTPTVDMEYTNFLIGGGAIFLMGENLEFPERDGAIVSLIQSLGGGGAAGIGLFDTCANGDDAQTVTAPFTGPNSVSAITYLCGGGFIRSGTGQFISQRDPILGTGLAFAPGTLSAAPLGTLTTILDVNFMEGDIDAASQNLLKNLIVYLDDFSPGTPPIVTPEPGTFAMLGVGLLGLGFLARKRFGR